MYRMLLARWVCTRSLGICFVLSVLIDATTKARDPSACRVQCSSREGQLFCRYFGEILSSASTMLLLYTRRLKGDLRDRRF